MNRALSERVSRLERKRRVLRLPQIVFGLFDKADADVIGVAIHGVVFSRHPREPLADLNRRAFAATGGFAAQTLYRQEAVPESASAPSPTQPSPHDVLAL
jgi:hypothetical protein